MRSAAASSNQHHCQNCLPLQMPSRASVFERAPSPPAAKLKTAFLWVGAEAGKTGWCSWSLLGQGVGGGVGGTRHKLKKDKGHYTGRLTYFTLRSGEQTLHLAGLMSTVLPLTRLLGQSMHPRTAEADPGPGARPGPDREAEALS